jgi:hypothetical protein
MKKHASIIAIFFLMTILSLTSLVETGRAQKTGGENLAPFNDNLASAYALALDGGSAVSITASNADATKESGEPNHAENAGGKSVWFKFVPEATVTARINTSQNGFDTLLAVYTGGNMGALSPAGYNDDCSSNCATASAVDLMLVAGQTYYIAVDGYHNGTIAASGTFKLNITTFNAPPADNFAGAYNLGNIDRGSIAGTNYMATREAGEPNHYNNATPGAKSVWYKWTPLSTFSAAVELTENFASVLKIYKSDAANPTFDQLTFAALNIDTQSYDGAHYKAIFIAEAGKTYYIAVAGQNLEPDAGNFQLKFGLNKLRHSTDFSGLNQNGSLSVFRPSNGTWYNLQSINASTPEYVQFGKNGDTPVPADYDGNGSTNLAVTRSENGLKIWHVRGLFSVQWGLAGDKAITGDFDRDGIADLAVIRATAQGLAWYIRQSRSGGLRAFNFGIAGDKPVFGDFDGDGATDIALVRNTAEGKAWYFLLSGYNTAAPTYSQFTATLFGTTEDVPAVEDYDGDGKTEVGFFRPSTGYWYFLRSSDGLLDYKSFGASGDIPQPGDYNGDGKADLAVFRPSNGTWYIWHGDGLKFIQWGASTDIPTSSLASLSQ